MPEPLPKPILKKSSARVSWSDDPIPIPIPIPANPIKSPSPANLRLVLPVSVQPQKKKKHPKRGNPCRLICSFLFVTLLILLVSLAVAGGLFYLWFAPKLPVFKLVAVHLNRFAVSPGPDSTSLLRTGASVLLEVKNPNSRLVFRFGGARLGVSVYNEDVELGSASRAGFTQPSGNFTVLEFVTRMGGGQEVDAETGKRLKAAVKSGAVRVNVVVKTRVGFGVGNFFKTGMVPADVVCNGVGLKRLRIGGPLTCWIKWFGW